MPLDITQEKIEQFIAGQLGEEGETEFLRRIVSSNERSETERILARIQMIQGDLNTRLRQGVEENYPRLLEQVSAIEHLDSAHTHFQHEMDSVTRKTAQIANDVQDKLDRVQSSVYAISNLTKMSRLLGDALSCLFKRELIVSKVRQELSEQLRSSLRSLNAGVVNSTMKAMQKLIDNPTIYQKELSSLMDESLRELDALFLQLGAQSNTEKASKFLPQLGTKLHNQMEQFQLLGIENAQHFAKLVGKVIATRVPANAPYAMRLVQTIYKSLGSHSDSVANVIRDSLHPLKTSIHSQSLANLFTAIDEILEQDEKREAIIVEKLNAILRAELASVIWDKDLQREMEINIGKALKYLAVKLENNLKFNEEEELRFIGRVSKTQTQNYLILNIDYEMTKYWPNLSAPFTALLKPALETIVDAMRGLVSLVLASMHEEDISNALPSSASSSDYIKELCGHLRVFRQHCIQLKPLNESFDVLPSFINFCIEQYLLHISLIRPQKEVVIKRFIKDFDYLCKNGLQIFDCKYSKMLNSSNQIQSFIQTMSSKFEEIQNVMEEDQKQTSALTRLLNSYAVPQWFIAHMLICLSDSELKSPHESAGWTIVEYVNWFNKHSELERWRFLKGLLDVYKQSVVARGGTEFVKQFPILNQLINNNTSGIIA
uniref:Conserved oligomeric Golgi complex subunit 5 n=1 Tax=Meloidogyne hapla TaxID=6305 RepID=A0A1I8C0C0_MELHA